MSPLPPTSQQEMDFLSFSPTLSQGERHLQNHSPSSQRLENANNADDAPMEEMQRPYSSMFRPPVSSHILPNQPILFDESTHSDSSSEVDAADFIENMHHDGDDEEDYMDENEESLEEDQENHHIMDIETEQEQRRQNSAKRSQNSRETNDSTSRLSPKVAHTTHSPRQVTSPEPQLLKQHLPPPQKTHHQPNSSRHNNTSTPATNGQGSTSTRKSPAFTATFTPSPAARHQHSPISSVYSNSSQKSIPESIEDIPKHLQKELTMKIRAELSDLVQRELRRIRKESEKIMKHEIQGLSQNDKLKHRIRELEQRLAHEQELRVKIESEYSEKQSMFQNETERYESLRSRFSKLELEYQSVQNQVTRLQSALEDKDRINRELDQRYQHLLKKTEYELAAPRQSHARKETPTNSDDSNKQNSQLMTQRGISSFEHTQTTSPASIEGEDTLHTNKRPSTDESDFESSRMSTASQSQQSSYHFTGARDKPSSTQFTAASFENWINEELTTSVRGNDMKQDAPPSPSPQKPPQDMQNSPLDSYGGTDLTVLLSGDPQAIAKSLISQARNPGWKQTSQHQQQSESPTSLSHGQSTTRFIPNVTLPPSNSPSTPTSQSASIPELIQRSNPLHRLQQNSQMQDDDTPKRSRYKSSDSGDSAVLSDAAPPHTSSLSQRATSSLASGYRNPLARAESAPSHIQNNKFSTAIRVTTKYEELLKQSTRKKRKSPPKTRRGGAKSQSTAASWSSKAKTLKSQLEKHESVVRDWKTQQSSHQQGYIQNVGILKSYFTAMQQSNNSELGSAGARITRLLETLYSLWENLETSFSVRQEFSSNMIHVLHIGETQTSVQHQQQNVQVVEQKLGQVIHDYSQELMRQSHILTMIRQRESLLSQIKQLSQQPKKQSLSERTSLAAQLKQQTKQVEQSLQQWSETHKNHHFEYRGIPYEVLLKCEKIKREYRQLEQEQQSLMKWTKRAGV